MAGAPGQPPAGVVRPAEWTLDALLAWLERAGVDVRLTGHLSLTHPATEVVAVEPRSDGSPRVTIETTLPALYGVCSPLPTHVTEQMLRTHDDAQRENAATTRAFLDVINHHVLALAAAGRASRSRPRALRTLVGALRTGQIDAEVARVRARHTALWTQRPCSVDALGRLLGALLPGWGVVVESGVPQAVRLHPDDRTRLGQANHRLGTACVVGGRVWRADAAVRVRLDRPEGDERAAEPMVRALIRAWSPRLLDVEVEIAGDRDGPAVLSHRQPRAALGRCRLTIAATSEPPSAAQAASPR